MNVLFDIEMENMSYIKKLLFIGIICPIATLRFNNMNIYWEFGNPIHYVL